MKHRSIWLAVAILLAGATFAGWGGLTQARPSAATVERLLETSKTVVGQDIVYPTVGNAKVVAVIVTMQPGAETGLHLHEVPLFGYMLEGELTVQYKDHGTRVYRKGDALMEAVKLPHDGRNTGKGPVRILAVFMGTDSKTPGTANTVKLGPGIEDGLQ